MKLLVTESHRKRPDDNHPPSNGFSFCENISSLVKNPSEAGDCYDNVHTDIHKPHSTIGNKDTFFPDFFLEILKFSFFF